MAVSAGQRECLEESAGVCLWHWTLKREPHLAPKWLAGSCDRSLGGSTRLVLLRLRCWLALCGDDLAAKDLLAAYPEFPSLPSCPDCLAVLSGFSLVNISALLWVPSGASEPSCIV